MTRRVARTALALGMLAFVGCGRESVKDLTAKLGSRDAKERAYAALKLAEWGPEARDAIPALIGALDDPDGVVSGAAGSTLVAIGEEAVQPLIAAMKEKKGAGGLQAALALGRIGKPAQGPLIEVLQAGDEDDSTMAVQALAHMGPHTLRAILLCDSGRALVFGGPGEVDRFGRPCDQETLHVSVMEALSQMGRPGWEELADIAVRDTGPAQREALKYLRRMACPYRSVPARLAPLLSSSDPEIRKQAQEILEKPERGSVKPAN